MSNELTVPKLNEAQLRIIEGKTPEQYVKTRPGRGGKDFSYVEVGYVIDQLNKAFSLAWDWEIEDQQVGKSQVWVKGRLTVYFSPVFKITKSAFGGAEIKKYQSGHMVDIADDLKAASADALKKAASMIGVASDIYFPQMDRLENGKVDMPSEMLKEAEKTFKCTCGTTGQYHAKDCPAGEIKEEEKVSEDLPF